MDKDALGARFDNVVDMPFFENGFAVDDDFVSLDRDHLAGIFVYEILDPCFQHTGSQFLPYGLLEVCFGDLDVFGQVEYL